MLREYLVEGGKPGVNADAKLQRRLRALADAMAPGSSTVSLEIAPSWQEQVVFTYWQTVLEKPQAKFTADRRAKVRARLREGYTVDDMKQAIDGIAQSAFHRGENSRSTEYVDLALVCQSGSKLEQFKQLAPARSERRALDAASVELGAQAEKHRELLELQRQASEQLKAGDTDAYNQTQKRIRALRSPRKLSGERARSSEQRE